MEAAGSPAVATPLPYAIGTAERDQWMACMRAAMAAPGVTLSLAAGLLDAFAGPADWKRNRDD